MDGKFVYDGNECSSWKLYMKAKLDNENFLVKHFRNYYRVIHSMELKYTPKLIQKFLTLFLWNGKHNSGAIFVPQTFISLACCCCCFFSNENFHSSQEIHCLFIELWQTRLRTFYLHTLSVRYDCS